MTITKAMAMGTATEAKTSSSPTTGQLRKFQQDH